MTCTNWRPYVNRNTLKKRADILQAVRQFFIENEVMEVETPLLCQHTVSNPHIDSFAVNVPGVSDKTMYLQTSPEYAMKRLLADGSGPIYQLCKAFRIDEYGRFHNPEFTMLEWYQPGYDEFALMDEVEALVQHVLATPKALRLSYQEAFENYCNINPLKASEEKLTALLPTLDIDLNSPLTNKDELLQVIFTHHIEKSLPADRPCFIYDFPASQAVLAQTSPQNPLVARRFELYVGGIELANGYFELLDATELRRRLTEDNLQREDMKKEKVDADQHLISAMEYGLPSCSGVALGFDRLVMLACEKMHIKEVISFTIENS